MSLQDRYQAARSALEAIAAFARDSQQVAIAAMAELGLRASEDTDVLRRARDADRKRRSRGHPEDITRMSVGHPASVTRTSNGHEGGEGGGVFSDSEEKDSQNPKVGGVGGGSAGHDSDVTRTSERRIRNASDDGAFGMTVDAWCEGISQVTGKPCTRPTHGVVRQLLDAQMQHRPVTEEPVAWSRKSAAEYAKARMGKAELSVFGYVRWLESPAVESPAKDLPPSERPAAKAERVARGRSLRDAERNRAPMPAALAALVGLAPAKEG